MRLYDYEWRNKPGGVRLRLRQFVDTKDALDDKPKISWRVVADGPVLFEQRIEPASLDDAKRIAVVLLASELRSAASALTRLSREVESFGGNNGE